MATFYGPISKRVTSNDIASVTLTNMTLITSGSDASGGFYCSAYVNDDSPGCGNPKYPIFLISVLDSLYTGWTKISFKSYGTFKCSCYSLNEDLFVAANNISTYNESLGDEFFKCENCFELPQFTTVTVRCDNESTNAFHSAYAVGSYRIWYQTRRNSLLSPAGPGIGFSCNDTGTAHIMTI